MHSNGAHLFVQAEAYNGEYIAYYEFSIVNVKSTGPASLARRPGKACKPTLFSSRKLTQGWAVRLADASCRYFLTDCPSIYSTSAGDRLTLMCDSETYIPNDWGFQIVESHKRHLWTRKRLLR